MRPGDNPPQSARDLLAAIGARLYGAEWIAPLAEALRIDRRTMERMRSGTLHKPSGGAWPIPPTVWEGLAELCQTESAELTRLASEARRWTAPRPDD